MFLIPTKFKSTQLSLGFSCCLVIGFFCLIVGTQTPFLSGQVIQYPQGFNQQAVIEQPVFRQPPSQVYQGQPIQGQAFQGQPLQGQPLQGPIFQGQIIQQPAAPNYQPVPTPIYQSPAVPPVSSIPPSADGNVQKSLDAKRAAYQEAINKVKRLSEKNEALLAQNEGTRVQFESLKQENFNLNARVGELGLANANIEATVVELREKLAQASEQVPGDTKEAEQLRAKYRESMDQIKNYQAEIGNLNAENQSYEVKISELNAAQQAMKLQPQGDMQAELACLLYTSPSPRDRG